MEHAPEYLWTRTRVFMVPEPCIFMNPDPHIYGIWSRIINNTNRTRILIEPDLVLQNKSTFLWKTIKKINIFTIQSSIKNVQYFGACA